LTELYQILSNFTEFYEIQGNR
jgi:hypothetical protein